MSGDRTYASVPERITWTTGFRCATDKLVLGALSTFANFETGKGARVSLKKLCARAELQRRTVYRALQRLEADGWIIATRRHRHATTRDIAIDRLAPHWMVPKVVGGVMSGFPQGDHNLGVNRGTQLGVSRDGQLGVTNDVQARDLSVNSDVQGADLSVKNDAPIPSTYLTPVGPIPSAPALRAGWFDDDDGQLPEGHAPQSAASVADVRADSRDRARGSDENPRRPADDHGPGGTEHSRASGVGVPLRQGADLPGGESIDRPRAPTGPQQQTFGPIDVSPSPARPAPQWGQLAEALRAGLKRKSG
jgi:hypothetical protein